MLFLKVGRNSLTSEGGRAETPVPAVRAAFEEWSGAGSTPCWALNARSCSRDRLSGLCHRSRLCMAFHRPSRWPGQLHEDVTTGAKGSARDRAAAAAKSGARPGAGAQVRQSRGTDKKCYLGLPRTSTGGGSGPGTSVFKGTNCALTWVQGLGCGLGRGAAGRGECVEGQEQQCLLVPGISRSLTSLVQAAWRGQLSIPALPPAIS